MSPKIAATERLQAANAMPLLGHIAEGIKTHGYAAQLNYGTHAAQGVLIQSELEYFARSGGVGNVPNAFLVG